MQHKTLKELESSKARDAVPYATSMVKINVVKVGHTATFTNSSGGKGSMLNFSVADGTDAMLATLSDETKFANIREGRSLTIRNFLVKEKRLVLSKQSKIMAGQAVELTTILKEKAVNLLIPSSPSKSLKEVLDAPVRTILTVTGEVVKVI
jgi:hypothetical protein